LQDFQSLGAIQWKALLSFISQLGFDVLSDRAPMYCLAANHVGIVTQRESEQTEYLRHREFVKVLSPCVTLASLKFVKVCYLLECLEILNGDKYSFIRRECLVIDADFGWVAEGRMVSY